MASFTGRTVQRSRAPLRGLLSSFFAVVVCGCTVPTSGDVVYIDPHDPLGSFRTAFKGTINDMADEAHFVASFDLPVVVNHDRVGLAEIHDINPYAVVYTYHKIAGLHFPDAVAPAGDPGWTDVDREGLLWYGPSGQPATNTQFGWVHVDILDPVKRAAWVKILLANIRADIDTGYDAVFLDNAGIIHSDLITELPAAYTPDGYYRAAGEVLAAVRAALPGTPIVINSYTGVAEPGNRGLELLDYADGLYFEGFSMKVSGLPATDDDRYQQQLDDFKAVLDMGKAAIGLDYGSQHDVDRRLFSVASLLMVADTHAYHQYAATDAGSDVQQFPEDVLDVGTPVGKRQHVGAGLYLREFTAGTVLTNPMADTSSYDLGAGPWERVELSGGGAYPNTGALTWVPLTGTSVRLKPATAAVVRHPSG
jgi:hypothetical protein